MRGPESDAQARILAGLFSTYSGYRIEHIAVKQRPLVSQT